MLKIYSAGHDCFEDKQNCVARLGSKDRRKLRFRYVLPASVTVLGCCLIVD